MADPDVGQLVWAFIRAREDIAVAERSARAGHVSGIWLLPTEMRSAAGTAKIVNRLQAAAQVPLLVGVDAEAGLGLVMEGATELPTAMAIGATGDPQLAREAAGVTAREASACGINVNAAPSIDVNVNPANPIINTRSFGGDPELVSRLGCAYIEATESACSPPRTVLPIGKHFPGHGDTVEDSHLQLGTVAKSREQLDECELMPFRAAIAGNVPMLMTAHVAYPSLDESGTPATLSGPILTDLLRRQLGFRGALVTDAMDMYAIAHNYEAGDAAVRAVLAGADLVLTDQWDLVYDALEGARREGRLSGERVHEAAQRIHGVKTRIFGPDLRRPEPIDGATADGDVGTPAHRAVAERIAHASVSLVNGAVPPPGASPLLLATRMHRLAGPPIEEELQAVLSALGWNDAGVMVLDPSPDATQVQEACVRGHAAGWVALLQFNRVQSFHPNAVLVSAELLSLTEQLAEADIPLTVVSMGSPYVLPLFRRTRAQICSYSTCSASLRATLNVLRGSDRVAGHLPVELT